MDRQAKILTSAAHLFHERGFHGVGIDDIGRAAGVSGPAVYRYFSGKDEILASLFNQAMDLVMIPPGFRYDDPFEELAFIVHHHAKFVVEHREFVSVYAHEHRYLPDPWRRLLAQRMLEHAQRWESTIATCYPEASSQDVLMAAQAAIGLLHSSISWPKGVRNRDDLTEQLSRLAIGCISTLSVQSPASSIQLSSPGSNAKS